MAVAVILAAGMGQRLMPLTADRPKALVEVAGKSILVRMVEACAAAGMSEVIIVTGYRHAAIDAVLAELALPAVTVFNDAFDTLGNAWSLYVAREAIGERDFVKLDGDVVLDPAILSSLLAAEAASAIVVDDQVALDDEAMKAQVRDGRVEALGKWLPIGDSAGESIGIEKIAAADAPALFEAIAAFVKDAPMAYYEDVYHALIERGWPLGAVSVGARRWTEIDDKDDLARANRLVE